MASLEAQQPDSPTTVERVRLALSQPTRLAIPTPETWPDPAPRRFGFVTLLPPEPNGQIIKVMIPVGDLVTRAARSLSNAHHRRAERHARQRVERDLRNFLFEKASASASGR